MEQYTKYYTKYGVEKKEEKYTHGQAHYYLLRETWHY